MNRMQRSPVTLDARRMSPLLRLWAWTAAIVAALLALRGAWLPALALFVLSPAPVLLFARDDARPQRLSLSWLGAVVIALVAIVGLLILVVALGGVPPVHEWRARLRG